MTDSKNKFEIRTFAWSDHSTRPQGGIALDLLSAFFALLSSNLLAGGEDLDRGTVVTGIKPRNTRNTQKRNEGVCSTGFRVFRVFRGYSSRFGCGLPGWVQRRFGNIWPFLNRDNVTPYED